MNLQEYKKKFLKNFMGYKKLDYNKVYRCFYINCQNSFHPEYNIYSLNNNMRLIYQGKFDSLITAKKFIDLHYSFLLDLDK